MIVYRKVVGLILALVFLALAAPFTYSFSPQPARAQQEEKQLVRRNFDAQLDVKPDGTMNVVETLRLDYVSGQWANGGRTIPLERVDDISEVRVFEATPDGNAPISAEQRREGGELQVTWPARAGPGDERTFRLEYTVEGVVRIYPEEQQLRWIAIPQQRRFPVESATVTLNLPGEVAPSNLQLESYPRAAARRGAGG
ncbi:MAG: DUF2207 domain-containing protein [Chloroflexia bacterium]